MCTHMCEHLLIIQIDSLWLIQIHPTSGALLLHSGCYTWWMVDVTLGRAQLRVIDCYIVWTY
jgi:hypothetical protein